MRTNTKRKIIPLSALLGCFIAAIVWSSNAGEDITWEVLFPGLPTEISVSKASHNAILYILKQTHEPLLGRMTVRITTQGFSINGAEVLTGKNICSAPTQAINLTAKLILM